MVHVLLVLRDICVQIIMFLLLNAQMDTINLKLLKQVVFLAQLVINAQIKLLIQLLVQVHQLNNILQVE